MFLPPQWLDERPVLPAEKGHTAASVTKEVTKKLRCAAGNSRRPCGVWHSANVDRPVLLRLGIKVGLAGAWPVCLEIDRLGYAMILSVPCRSFITVMGGG